MKRIPSLMKSKAETFTDVLRSSRSKGSHKQKESKAQPHLCGNDRVRDCVKFKEALMISFKTQPPLRSLHKQPPRVHNHPSDSEGFSPIYSFIAH